MGSNQGEMMSQGSHVIELINDITKKGEKEKEKGAETASLFCLEV